MLCPPGRNGIAEYLAAELPKPKGSLDSPTFLDLPESIEQFGRINVCNRARSDVGNMSASSRARSSAQ